MSKNISKQQFDLATQQNTEAYSFRIRSREQQTLGFTLIELLISTAIFGIISIAIFSVYASMQTTTLDSTRITNTQQSLRVSAEILERDIYHAGFLMSSSDERIATSSDSETLQIYMLNLEDGFAVISSEVTVPNTADIDDIYTLTVLESIMTDTFQTGEYARVYRPSTNLQLFDTPIEVSSITRETPSLSITGFKDAEEVSISEGDVIFTVESLTSPEIATITWTVDEANNLIRTKNDVAETIATSVSSLQFTYQLEDGTSVSELTDSLLDELTGIEFKITMIAQKTKGDESTRSLVSRVALRNF
jgi:prepilin-type N-terminal cleavage/methylation domain-containing protein